MMSITILRPVYIKDILTLSVRGPLRKLKDVCSSSLWTCLSYGHREDKIKSRIFL